MSKVMEAPLFEYLTRQESAAREALRAPGPIKFAGAVYEPERDKQRLTGQILRVFDCMRDGRWRIVSEIAAITQDPETSVSAQLRNLRKPQFGSHNVIKRHRGEPARGLWEFRLEVNE